MSGLDHNRKRNQTICFRMSPEERRELEVRIKLSGLPKGTYMIQSSLHQEIHIELGKYQSDRLSIEIRRLREKLETMESHDEKSYEELQGCRSLIKQLIEIMEGNA